MLFLKPNVEKLKAKRDIKRLLKALTNRDPSIRKSAAQALGELGDTQAVEPLCNALSDEDRHVRGAAAEALVAIGDPRAFEAILKSDVVLWAKASGLFKLAQPHGAQAVDSLLRVLKDSRDRFGRAEVAGTLGMLGDRRAVKPLIQALNEKDEIVSSAAAEALGKLAAPEAVPALSDALRSDYGHIHSQAREALKAIGSTTALEALAKFEAEKELKCVICKKIQSDKSRLVAVVEYHEWARDYPSPGDISRAELYCLECAESEERKRRPWPNTRLEKYEGVKGYQAVWHFVRSPL